MAKPKSAIKQFRIVRHASSAVLPTSAWKWTVCGLHRWNRCCILSAFPRCSLSQWIKFRKFSDFHLYHHISISSPFLQCFETVGNITNEISLSLSLLLHFNGHFPVGPGLAGTRMSAFWILMEQRVMEVVVTTGAIRRAKPQSNCYHQQTNTQLLQAGCPSSCPTNSVKALTGKHNKGNMSWKTPLSGIHNFPWILVKDPATGSEHNERLVNGTK